MARGAVGLFQRGSTFWLRTDIPKDLQSTYGRARVQASLKTSNRQEAILRATRQRSEWLEEFEAKRKALNPQALEAIWTPLKGSRSYQRCGLIQPLFDGVG